MESSVRRGGEVPGRRSDDEDSRHVERHDRLGVGVVPEEHLAPQAVAGLRHLGRARAR